MNSPESYLVIGLLALIAVLLMVLPKRLKPNQSRIATEIASTIREAINSLGQETRHYVQVNAVLALTRQLEQHPELLDRLGQYSSEVVAAALLVRVNALGNDINLAQRSLSAAEKNVSGGLPGWELQVTARRKRLDELEAQLMAANQAVQQFSSAHV